MTISDEESRTRNDRAGLEYWDQLHSKRDVPGLSALGVNVLGDAVGHPEADEGTALVDCFEETRHTAADGRRRQLGDVGWCHGNGAADANAADDATSIHGTQVPVGDSTADGSDGEEQLRDDQRDAATVDLDRVKHEDGPKKAADGV